MTGYLAEVPESEAAGTIAETYAEIRATLAVPVVNLVYRHLAADPGRLEPTWTALRPNLAHPKTRKYATQLSQSADRFRPRVAPLEREAVLRSGVRSAEFRQARATLAVYERANALNLLAVSALLSGTPGSEELSSQPTPERPCSSEILPMADATAPSGATRAILDELSAAFARPGEDTLVPSLYRHLAASPALLQLVWEAVGQSLRASEVARAAESVREQAATLANRLPFPVDAVCDSDIRAVLERFAPVMAMMLVSGRIIDEALGSTPTISPTHRD